MIYLDSSVVLARLLAEDRTLPASVWDEPLVSSRVLLYEVWNRFHAFQVEPTRGDQFRELIARIALLDLTPDVLARALEPFPTPVRTLDSLHLASVEYLRAQRQRVELASFDRRMIAAARVLRIPLYSA